MNKYSSPFCLALLGLLCAATLASCHHPAQSTDTSAFDADTIPADAEQYVRIETSEGNIVLRLYRDVPIHRHNFVRLARSGWYDGQTFYRIVNNSLVQAGDPASRTASRDTPLGSGDQDYTLTPELKPETYIHTRGAIAMASYKPQYESSGGQFYIVTGMKQNDTRLANAETHLNKKRREFVFDSITKQPCYQEKLKLMQKNNDKKGIWNIKEEIKSQTDEIMSGRKPFAYTKQQKEAYRTLGGEPTLDGLYTVFGEMIEGDDVLTKIEKRAVNSQKRPLEDVRILRVVEINNPALP